MVPGGNDASGYIGNLRGAIQDGLMGGCGYFRIKKKLLDTREPYRLVTQQDIFARCVEYG